MWTTKYKRLLKMCIVQHVETKNMFTFQLIKRLVSTTVKSAKPAATFWLFLLRTEKRKLCCLLAMGPIVSSKGRIVTTKKTIPIFEEICPPITTKHIRTWTKKSRSYSIYGIIVSTPHRLIQLNKTSFTVSFFTLSVYIKATWFSQSPTTVLSDLSTSDKIKWPSS